MGLIVDIDLTLRTSQVDYLEYLAECWEAPFSRALRRLIDSRIAAEMDAPSRPPRKFRKHVKLEAHHLTFIDKIAAREGLSRSDIARRLIDEARLEDQTL